MDRFAKLISAIVIPTLTLISGALGTAWWTSRTLSVQELALAIQVSGSEKQTKATSDWANRTIEAYINTKPPDDLSGDSAGYFVVSKSIAEDVCLFPHQSIEELQPFFLDDVKDDELVGQNAKVLLFKSVAAYADARRRYNMVIKLLRDGCGFLPKLAAKMKDGE